MGVNMGEPVIRGLRPVKEDFKVSCPFGKPGSHWKGGFHKGVDFSCPEGTPVLAFAAGEVQIAHDATDGFGLRIIVLCDGYRYINAHLSKMLVKVGETVPSGYVLGLSGNTGNSTGPHLHFEVRVQPEDKAVQPEFV